MSERVIAVICQPCILCESTLERWHVWLNEEVGIERIEVEEVEHHCQPLRDLSCERVKAVYKPTPSVD